MKLKRVKPDDTLELDDRAAERPDDLPDDEELERRTKKLGKELSHYQEALYGEGKQALLVVFQARDTGGKDGAIKKVFGPLNPQGSYTAAFKAPTEEELAHDFLWRVHRVVPEKGFIGIFNRSHYEDVLVVRVEKLAPEEVWKRRYRQINDFERLLSRSGTRILKFFLHISRDEQRERLLARLDDPEKNWKFQPSDIKARERWDDYTAAYRDALTRCSTPWAPWYVIPANSKRVRDYLVAKKVASTLRKMNPRLPPADPEVLQWRDKIL